MKSLKIILFLSMGLIITIKPSFSAKKKKTISKSCLNCLNSFSATTLNFPKNIRGKCTKTLTTCDKTDRTGDCEKVINECIEYNCSATGSCSNAKSNRALLFGCLSAENKFMPYQCRNYIKGKASSLAEQAKATAKQEELKKEAEIKAAEAEAEKAKQQTEQAALAEKTKQTQIENEAKIKQEQIKGENDRKLKEKEKELELKMAREQKKEKLNSNPNVKYNKTLNNVKKAISQAKRESKTVLAQMGIQSIKEETCEEYEKKYTGGEKSFEFPPKCVRIEVIDKNKYKDNGTTQNAIASTLYYIREESEAKKLDNIPFVCNKDIKESFVKGKLDTIYKILTTANENLTNDISEIENSSFDETTQFIQEDKFDILYNIQNNINSGLKQIQEHISILNTSCETRCKGFNGDDIIKEMILNRKSSIIEYDEKGNIIEDKPSENSSAYSCSGYIPSANKETKQSSSFDITALIGSTKQQSNIPDNQNKIAMDITERTTRAALEVDKILEEVNIIAMSNKIKGISNYAGGGSYYGSQNSSSCPRLDKTEFAVCMYSKTEFITNANKYLARNQKDSSLIKSLGYEIKDIYDVLQVNECEGIDEKTANEIKAEKLKSCIKQAYEKIKEIYNQAEEEKRKQQFFYQNSPCGINEMYDNFLRKCVPRYS